MNVACVASMGCRLVGGRRWGGESFLETSHLIELHVFESHFCETVGISDTLKMLCYDEIQCKSWWKGRFGPPHYLAWWQAFQFPLSLQPTACIWVYAKVADFFFFFFLSKLFQSHSCSPDVLMLANDFSCRLQIPSVSKINLLVLFCKSTTT